MPEPKVRFKRDDGSSYPTWETIPMSEIFTEISEKNHPEMPVLSVQQGVGTVLRDASDRNILYDKSNLKNYKAMKKDDYIIHLRSFEGGLECSNYDGISSPAYRILRAQKIIPSAYRDYFRSYEFIHNKLAVSVVGIRDGKNIDMETFWQIPMSVPCTEEQQKIADFLSSVDEVISASEEEITNLEKQKKAVMKKIFSQEMRFRREDGSDFPEWEKKKLGDIIHNVTSVKRIHAEDWRDSGVPFYRAREIVALYNKEPISPLFIDEELYEEFSEVSGKIQEGDLLVTGVGTIGIPYLVKKGDRFYFKDGNIIWIQNNGNIDGQYLYALYGTPYMANQLVNMSGKGTVHTYTIENAKKTIIPFPCLEEQRLIADFLSSFDEAITAAKKELELWKELKKGLLQQMFV